MNKSLYNYLLNCVICKDTSNELLIESMIMPKINSLSLTEKKNT